MPEMLNSNYLMHSLHLLPMIFLGAVAMLLILDRVVCLFVVYPIPRSHLFVNRIRDLVARGKLDDAVALCERNASKPLAKLILAGLLRANQGDNSIRFGLELALTEAGQKIAARTPFLATMANVSTLLGLVGTVMGLIQSFGSVGELSAQQRGAAMAAGIATAMNSTLLGLGVAIICMISFSILINRVNKMNSELERAALITLDVIMESYMNENSLDSDKAA